MEPAVIPAWNFLGIFSTPVQMISNQFHVNFRKWPRSLHILCDFKFSTATPMKYHNHTVFVYRGFPFTLKQQKNMFLPRLALSVTCTNTPSLSAGNCLQDAGMLESGILHIRAAAHFGFHRDTVSPQPAETLSCVFHCMWVLTFLLSACDVRDTAPIPRSHICATTSKLLVPYLEAFRDYVQSMLNMSHPFAGSTPFAPADSVCRPTSHGAGELPSSTVNWFRCYPRWRIHNSQPVALTASSRFHLGGSVEHVWDEMECWFRHLCQQPSEANKSAIA